MKEPILVVMAAGLGSRYGGLKQLDAMGPSDELLIDYSVYDAKEAGFSQVIFVIKEAFESEFKAIIGNRMAKYIQVSYAYQDLKDLPNGIDYNPARTKPWGTAHAVYAARHLIDAPFLVINADDYYGKEAYSKMYDYLSQTQETDTHYAMVGYELRHTVTEHGYVSRGVCDVSWDGQLIDVVERVKIKKEGSTIDYYDNETTYALDQNTIVSMNFWGFKPSIFKFIETDFCRFFENDYKQDPLKAEFFLPRVVNDLINNDNVIVTVLPSGDQWYGVTYPQDKLIVTAAITKMTNEGLYPVPIWGA